MCFAFFVNWGKSGTDEGAFFLGTFVPTLSDYVV
eukprot:CAMPEP_0167743990 /NCGR_PEP_ID=MMETSP0110_2-20121227/2325_1 /TAXON_ID=629695 /ORGANISM="Gymnochlora sp., Strain CCMP2014" /LENGTH=33 /DNA_ID= /DNA_START= /DNA_END= /DNA_ORIENTATION=